MLCVKRRAYLLSFLAVVEPDAPAQPDCVAEPAVADVVRLGQQRGRVEGVVVCEQRLEDVPHDLVREDGRRHLDVECRGLTDRPDLEDAARARCFLGVKVRQQRARERGPKRG